MMKALALEKNGVMINLLINTQIIFSWIIDIVVYKSKLDFMKLFGASIVLGSVVYTITQRK